jgi:hypothetical protein
MRRLILVLSFVLASCSDPTAPAKTPRPPCWAFVTLAVDKDHVFQFWFKFDPCPPDEWLYDNGWTKSIDPMWASQTERNFTMKRVILSDSSSGHED